MRKWIFSISLTIGAAIAAYAGTVSTPTSTLTPGQYALHNPDNTPPAPFTEKTNRFDTLALCDAAAKSLNKTFKYKCDLSTLVTVTMTVTNTCTDEKAPTLPLELKEQDGQKYWEIPTGIPQGLTPPEPSEANDWATMVYAYVKNPKGDAAYPACWVRGFVPEDDWEVNPNAPGTPFLQIKGQSPIKTAENTIEPMTTPPGYQEEWDARQAADAAACAAGETKRCPQVPYDKPGACGWYYEASCNNGIDPRAQG